MVGIMWQLNPVSMSDHHIIRFCQAWWYFTFIGFC